MAAFREHTLESLARIETHVDTLLSRQAEDRKTVLGVAQSLRDDLKSHTSDDAANFGQLRSAQARMQKLVYGAAGGLVVLQTLIQLISSGVLKF